MWWAPVGTAAEARTGGLGYGEYARKGFGQLVCVAGLTLVVIAGAVWLDGVFSNRRMRAIEEHADRRTRNRRDGTSRMRGSRRVSPSGPGAIIECVLLLTRLICSDVECAECVEECVASLAELDALACDCGCTFELLAVSLEAEELVAA